jgi:alpha-ketoglutarate-dependent 2,4-dichlorophenoxyacetate dioxygenase
MSLFINIIGPDFVGEVSGIDISKPLSSELLSELQFAIDHYAVLVFRDCKLTDDQQLTFTKSFGQIENAYGGTLPGNEQENRLVPGLIDVSNLDAIGQPLSLGSRTRYFNMGNMLWHSDSSYKAIPAKYSLLSARVVNPVGGNTEFADMRAAYDALESDVKAEIDGLICEHSQMYSRGALGLLDYSDEEKQLFKPVRQSLVRVHPTTGRKSLYLSAHAGGIVGMPTPQARIILKDLNEHATQPKFVYVHKWRLNDFVMWDNRQTMHRVRRYDETMPRDMRRTTVAGDSMTVPQA